MKTQITFCILFIISVQFCYSQITITEIKKSEEKIALKPEPYDSLIKWEYKERLGDYKQYIGLQVYLPPISNKPIGDWTSSQNNFLFSLKSAIIKTNVKSIHRYYSTNKWVEHVYDSLITFVYEPFHYYYGGNGAGGRMVGVCSDSAKVSNTYFTILNVIYAEKLDSIFRYMRNTLYEFEEQKRYNIFVPRFRDEISGDKPSFIFLLKNNSTNDSLYCFFRSDFILVPYFIKQKNLYLNKKLIYDDEKTDGVIYKNSTFEKYDTRYVVKYEDDYGNKKSTYKKVLIEPGSKWYCSDVTLLKPSYEIHYIIKNDKDEQVALTRLRGFIEEKEYLKREANKKLQHQQLLAKQKQEKLEREENERKEIEKRKAECISLFGQQNGELIAQGKVRINMTKDMCKYAWGVPLWTSKIMTEYGTYEDWYYWLGYSLHFENGLLKRIEE